ncbi:class I SAM-dependent methyltransferase [Acinetobacter faecalis]|uniref:class I SAM-dependent methyltransferase n=1 Tax=Acinetobacter faecalis TaxID=2665161 RepID=UPI002A920183|nr:class I SAM-dependent methyltransferase [Acinetobacter faecalis]MDY6456207.1 class I SAM-dependent methyltransferase [Acinetobacter faecalis]
MKDLFSSQSQLYQKARPNYPQSVINEILKHVEHKELAWDCGAGSGQFTQLLSPYFSNVIATDLSQQQLDQAPVFSNVEYLAQPAEENDFPSAYFDLITVAQAIHWFNFDIFYKEVKRVLKPDGVFAVVGYGLLEIKDVRINDLVQKLYYQTLKGYWDAERKYIDEEYLTIPFPFQEIDVPKLSMEYSWSAAQLLDYLNTWSAIKHYKKKNEDDPLATLKMALTEQDVSYEIEFPILLRIGR